MMNEAAVSSSSSSAINQDDSEETSWYFFEKILAAEKKAETSDVTSIEKEVPRLIRKIESSMKDTNVRMKTLEVLIEKFHLGSSSFVDKMLENNYLHHVRAWLELSLNSKSKNEKRFRLTLLQQLEFLQDRIQLKYIKESRLNKAILKCATNVHEHLQVKKIASNLLQRFSGMLIVIEQSSAIPPMKRAKMMRRRQKS